MDRVIIIPALKPDEKLRDIVEQNWNLESQTIVVDDGSGEEFTDFFDKLEEKCIVLHHKENLGKGEAIKTALQYIQQELWECGVIGIMDADGQHLPKDMDRLLSKAEECPGALVLGCRQMGRSVPWKSRIGNRITCRVFKWITGVSVSDTQTGLRAFSSELLELMLEIPGSRYEYEINVLTECARRGIEIIELPARTIYHDKHNSCSHFRKIRDSVKIYKELMKFSFASLISFLLDYLLFCLLACITGDCNLGLWVAIIWARMISGVCNYTINSHLVFCTKRTAGTAAKYILLAVLILLMNNAILYLYAAYLHIPSYVAKALTEVTLFAASFLAQKEMVFVGTSKKAVEERVKQW